MYKVPGFLLAIMLVSVLVVSGCSSTASSPIFSTTQVTSNTPTTTDAPTTKVTTSPTSTAAIEAAQLYSLNCATCHGSDRLGVPGHLLTTNALANTTMSSIIYIINHGHGSDMPGYTNLLTTDQVNALANYLKTTTP